MRFVNLWFEVEKRPQMAHLEDPTEDDDGALNQRPGGHVVQIGLQQVVVSGLESPGQLLELPHHLDAPVHAAQGLSEIL